MSTQRTHCVTTSDGAIIGGAVHGQGPSLVFLQGMLGDGDLDWDPLIGHLTGRFTCHLPSWRGRGLSGNHPDLSFGRMVEDTLAYVDSIDEPIGLVAWSFGANLALVAAAQSDAMPSVATIGPVAMGLADEQEQAILGETVARTGELAAQGNLTAAAHAIAGLPFNDEEIALAQDAGYLEATGRYVPHLLELLQQWMEYQGPTIDDPAVLGAISAPGARAARGQQPLSPDKRAARCRPRPRRTGTRDPRRRACRPIDTSRGARRGTRRVLHAGLAVDLALLARASPQDQAPWTALRLPAR